MFWDMAWCQKTQKNVGGALTGGICQAYSSGVPWGCAKTTSEHRDEMSTEYPI